MNRSNPDQGPPERASTPLFETMAVVGVGLIGGSLARAARERGLVSRIVGLGRGRENLRKALELGVIDAMETDWGKGMRDAGLVVLATPVESIVQLLPKIGTLCGDDTVVTDVGSVKGSIVREAERTLTRPILFVWVHRIAGTEKCCPENKALGTGNRSGQASPFVVHLGYREIDCAILPRYRFQLHAGEM